MELYELTENFHRIFAGNQRGHGEYTVTGNKGQKAVGKATTIVTPVTLDLWEKHLKGEKGIGIVPITENNSCSWGAIDIDEYEGMDLDDLSFKLPQPLVLCRSKSGGAHIYLFMQTPTGAVTMRKKLQAIAAALGHPNAEVFPKQDKLGNGDIGNWINMPYFKHDATTRYCLKSGVILTAEEFIVYVAENSLTQQQLVALKVNSIFEGQEDPEFDGAPPCLKRLIETGFPPGSRNSALFSMGVFARMKYPNNWEDKVFEYNQRFMGPGSYSEVAGIIRSLNKKSYVYKCNDQPLKPVCDKETCRDSQYGIQPSKDDEKTRRPCILDEVDRPVKCYAPDKNSKDEPYWVFSINGQNIDVTVDMVRSQTVFAREYLRQYHRVILPIKENKWVIAINELLADAEIHQLAPDAGPEGQLLIHLEDFCTNKAKAKAKEELLLGKPWQDRDRTYFRVGDLVKYLDQQRFRAVRGNEIFPILKRRGAKHHTFQLNGKCVACWSIDSFSEQDKGFESPKVEDDGVY